MGGATSKRSIVSYYKRGRAMTRRPKPVHQMSIAQFEAMFPDEDACITYLFQFRYNNRFNADIFGTAVGNV
jgi:hypothetical protein